MRSALWLGLVAAVTPGCRQVFGIDPPRLAGDAGGDVADAPFGPPADASYCYGPAAFPLCFETAPTGTVTPGATLDTTASASCMEPLPASWTAAGQPDVCLIAVADVNISSNLRVTGTRPLVVVAAATITVSATLDVSSHAGGSAGAGAGSPPCTGDVLDGGGNATAGGGGAGGTLATPGANGVGSFGTGGVSCPASTALAPLRGGPNGGTGGYGADPTGNTPAGLGGGAVFLAAGTSITISGAIDASGGGGGGGTYFAGGGGGGAGGTIALYAPTITAFGTLMTNGGGGGTAGGNNGFTANGGDPLLSTPLAGGAGGVYESQSTGGDGCGHGTPATSGSGGGASGGGGCGFILSNQPLSGATVSPGVTPF